MKHTESRAVRTNGHFIAEPIIEKGVAFPSHRIVYPFRKMEVGDSFFVVTTSANLASKARNFSKKNPGFKFTTRKVREGKLLGARVWRVPS